ncbi:MAG: sorbitol-6-phosphate dehydrogenase [Firmicutes bacterium]|nr:sorbitol-6-phosphate dehydrogenase [Bacillota bacterium]
MERRLEDKIALVTGAGQGIGRGLALRLAREGCHVVVADLNEATASTVVEEIRALDRRAIAVKVDVGDAAQVAAMVDRAVAEFGRIDILVSNAGILKSFPITDFPEEAWDAIIRVNLKGNFLCMREVAKQMIKQRSGKIISMSSKSGKKGSLWNAGYCASKFGIIGLVQSVALDLAPFGINVNAVCPGNVFETPLWDQLDVEYSRKLGIPPEKVREKYIEKVPLGRGCTIEDVANVVVFLASKESDYMTGQAINVTGGQEMR